MSDTGNNLPDDDLPMAAHRYLAGELTGSELERFEERLANDCAAQETLADVVLIQEALNAIVADAVHHPANTIVGGCPSSQMPHRTQRWPIVATAVAICLIGFVIWQGRIRPNSPIERETVAVWSELSLDVSAYPVEHTDASADDSFHHETTEEMLEVPDWLFAAMDAIDARETPARPESEQDEETL